jgi:hypothetical protein
VLKFWVSNVWNSTAVPLKFSNCFLTYNFFRKKNLRQPSIDFCNLSSSGDASIQGTLVTLTPAGYWFILRFCEHFTCLSSYIQNAIKLENISNLITSPSSYQCRETTVNMKVSGLCSAVTCAQNTFVAFIS